MFRLARFQVPVAIAIGLSAAIPGQSRGQATSYSIALTDANQFVLTVGDASATFKGKLIQAAGIDYAVDLTVTEKPVTLALKERKLIVPESGSFRLEFLGGGVLLTNALDKTQYALGLDVPARPGAVFGQAQAAETSTALTERQRAYLRVRIGDMIADASGPVTSRDRLALTEWAEHKAAEFLHLEGKPLPAPVGIDIRDLVNSAIRVAPPRARVETWNLDDPTPGQAADPVVDRVSSRCECEYCHPLHAAGTCPLPYRGLASTVSPPSQGVGFAPVAAVGMAPAPKRHWLHHLLCPCSWCRGHR